VHGVAFEEGVVFLLLNALSDRLFVALGKIAGDGFSFFAGFGAFEYDDFLHGVLNVLKIVGSGSKPAGERGATIIFCGSSTFSMQGSREGVKGYERT
jgi:hypothetical protein